jgi:quercetin dioxygenase-like cupin family protein
MDPVISRAGDGERYARGNRTITIRIDLPGLSVLEIAFDETFTVDPHTHDDHDDTFLVLDGEVEFTLGDDTVRAGPGTLVAAPPGARHGFRSAGGTARVLNFHAPDAGFVEFIRGSRPAPATPAA